MTHGDISFGMSLKEMAGWNQLPVDWERFLEFEPEGCFLARCDGKAAGTATAIAYEKLFGWVGMVLVHPDMRRRGLGTGLLMAAIGYLENKGVAAVKLDATPMGKELYDTIGFVDEYRMARWEGRGKAAPAPGGLTELTASQLETVFAFDRLIFGADRRRVLHRMLSEPTIRTVGSFDEAGKLEGYAALRPGHKAMYLGPWIATGPSQAGSCGIGRWRPPVTRPYSWMCWAQPLRRGVRPEAGFTEQRYLIRMYRGRNVSPGRPELQYGIFGPEVG